jgi:hypothetical protein
MLLACCCMSPPDREIPGVLPYQWCTNKLSPLLAPFWSRWQSCLMFILLQAKEKQQKQSVI